MFPQCSTCGREPMAYDELCEHPQPIKEEKQALLKASMNALELLRQELAKEHAETCDGFYELDPQYDGDPNEGKKVLCRVCFPED